jgi:hypothetical protein
VLNSKSFVLKIYIDVNAWEAFHTSK